VGKSQPPVIKKGSATAGRGGKLESQTSIKSNTQTVEREGLSGAKGETIELTWRARARHQKNFKNRKRNRGETVRTPSKFLGGGLRNAARGMGEGGDGGGAFLGMGSKSAKEEGRHTQ